MKCDHCGKNEASSRFVVNYMGNMAEVHLCSECLSAFQQQYAAGVSGFVPAPAGASFGGEPLWEGFSPAKQSTRVLVQEPEGNTIPADVGEELKQRRRLAELKARLQAAIEMEDYESAARFRDELYRAGKECDAHAT